LDSRPGGAAVRQNWLIRRVGRKRDQDSQLPVVLASRRLIAGRTRAAIAAFGSVSLVTAAAGFYIVVAGPMAAVTRRVVRRGKEGHRETFGFNFTWRCASAELGRHLREYGRDGAAKDRGVLVQRRYPAQVGLCGLQQRNGDRGRASLGGL